MTWTGGGLMSGDGFKFFDLEEPLGRTAVGICMGEYSSFCMDECTPGTG
jgi:hypothetical protein